MHCRQPEFNRTPCTKSPLTYSNIQYIMDFSNDPDIISGLLDLDVQIAHFIEGRNVYTVKFVLY